jgi:hypothetical protein
MCCGAGLAWTFHSVRSWFVPSGPVLCVIPRDSPYLPGSPNRPGPRPAVRVVALIADFEAEMLEAAEKLKFEYAATLRDEIKDLERQLQEVAS